MPDHPPRHPRSRPRSWWERLLGAAGGPRRPPPSTRYVARPVGPPAARSSPPSHRGPGVVSGSRGVYGAQARRQGESGPYLVAFAIILLMLGVFFYLGISWATGAGRDAGQGRVPSPVALPSPSPSPSPSPTPERLYVVKPGDTPAAIAQQFGVSAEALLQENGIADPRSLQVGQILRIPPPRERR